MDYNRRDYRASFADISRQLARCRIFSPPSTQHIKHLERGETRNVKDLSSRNHLLTQ
jgi:hypothetical protein